MDITTPLSLGDIIVGSAFSGLILLVAAAWLGRSAEARIILLALFVKILACVAHNLIMFYIIGPGDSVRYHYTGLEYTALIHSDLSTGSNKYLSTTPFFWVESSSTYRMYSLSGLTHFLLLDSYLASSFFFSLFGFFGQLLLYRTFTSLYPDTRVRKLWVVGILFLPSLTLWSAGLLKDPLGLWGLGCVVWGMHCFLTKPTFKSILLVFFGFYTLVLFRLQIMPVLLIALTPWLLSTPRSLSAPEGSQKKYRKYRQFFNSPIIRFLFVLIGLAIVPLAGRIQSRYAISELPGTLEEQSDRYERRGGAHIGSNEGDVASGPLSWTGLIINSPNAIVATLFRPFLWEAPGFGGLLAALENLVLLIFSVRGLWITIANHVVAKKVIRSPIFITSLIFTFIFAIMIGTSTPNLGTLSRYRLPLMPFWIAALVIIQYHYLQHTVKHKRRQKHQHYYQNSINRHELPNM